MIKETLAPKYQLFVRTLNETVVPSKDMEVVFNLDDIKGDVVKLVGAERVYLDVYDVELDTIVKTFSTTSTKTLANIISAFKKSVKASKLELNAQYVVYEDTNVKQVNVAEDEGYDENVQHAGKIEIAALLTAIVLIIVGLIFWVF